MNKDQLTGHHELIWLSLTRLDEGETILGDALMSYTGIKDRRVFYQVINDLRKLGKLVGSSKHQGSQGYFEIRDQNDFNRWIIPHRKTTEELRLIERCMTAAWEENGS